MAKLFGYGLEPDFNLATEERKDRFTWAFWIGAILLIGYGFLGNLSVQMFQAYVATAVCYGLAFYVKQRDHVLELWLWKAILSSVPVHIIYLLGVFWLDREFPDEMKKAMVFTPVLILGGAIEYALFDSIANYFKPSSTDQSPAIPVHK